MKYLVFDTETTGIDQQTAELVGLCFSTKPNEAYYVPVPEDFIGAQKIVHVWNHNSQLLIATDRNRTIRSTRKI